MSLCDAGYTMCASFKTHKNRVVSEQFYLYVNYISVTLTLKERSLKGGKGWDEVRAVPSTMNMKTLNRVSHQILNSK